MGQHPSSGVFRTFIIGVAGLMVMATLIGIFSDSYFQWVIVAAATLGFYRMIGGHRR
jgi:hypothetical protein